MGCSHANVATSEPEPTTQMPCLLTSTLACAKAEHAPKISAVDRGAALCFEGGGWRAFAVDTGLTAGLLAACKKYTPLKPTLTSSGLLNRFHALSSGSGGTWFAASLIYSETFVNLIEEIALSPESAGSQFKQGWISKWLETGSGRNEVVQAAEKLGDLLESDFPKSENFVNAAEELIQAFTTASNGFVGHTWTTYIEALLSSTAGIDKEVKAGSPVLAWASGKVWAANHSVITGGLPSLGGGTGIAMWAAHAGRDTLTYNTKKGLLNTEVTAFSPAAFTVTLGAGLDSKAPSKYSNVPLPELEYRCVEAQGGLLTACCQPQKLSGESSDPEVESSLEDCAGMLPLGEICAASSAVFGLIGLEGVDSKSILPTGTQLVPWISNAPYGHALREGQALVDKLFQQGAVSKQALDEITHGCVRGVVDAGFTDGTGIAKAVAMGATRVTAFLNLDNSTAHPSGTDFKTGSYLLRLFQGGADVGNSSGYRVFLPIFENKASSVEAQYENFKVIQASEGSELLSGIRIGTIKAMTCESSAFGIAAGQSVTINVVSVGSLHRNYSNPIGPPVNYFNYDKLVQEIANSLLADNNKELVENILLPMFLH
jgi:hypothetical protein